MSTVAEVKADQEVCQVDSQTAQEYIARQLQLESEAKEALPFQFDSCTKPLGPLKQAVFACLTCQPSNTPSSPAGICYSCSISCHGEHELVELFTKRDFECDCGTTRLPGEAPCTIRSNSEGSKGVFHDIARPGNKYNQNFQGRFCACGDTYDAESEKGTMFQCLGLGDVSTGGCGEDWFHPECLIGIPRRGMALEETKVEGRSDESGDPHTSEQSSVPPGFPAEDDFDHLICYKCVDANPWLKAYAGTTGFLPPVLAQPHDPLTTSRDEDINSNGKRRVDDESEGNSTAKRTKIDSQVPDGVSPSDSDPAADKTSVPKHTLINTKPHNDSFSLFLKEDFRDHLCRCAECFPRLATNPQLLEEEEIYNPPVSEDGDGAGDTASMGSKSLLDMGEAALSTMDRTKAIEGVMAYNHLRDKVKAFLQPFAESGKAVGAEDVKAYFAKLRGDDEAVKMGTPSVDDGRVAEDARKDQEGY